MVKLLSIAILLILSVNSCKQKQNINYFWLASHGKNYERLDSIGIKRVETEIFKNGIQRLTYYSKDTMTYYVKPDAVKNSRTNIKSVDERTLRLDLDTTILISKDTLRVQKYILDEEIMDGGVEYYWSPEIGVFAIHSSTWPGLTVLTTNDSMLNRKIFPLTKATVPDFFIRDKFKSLIQQ
jgi:hypothetical protein